jgi:uncharacterized protein YuzE
MQKFNFSYDKENDDLFIFNPKSKSRGSVELGNIILDFNAKKELVGIQIMDASNIIADIINEKSYSLVKKLLSNLKSCRVDIKPKGNFLIVKIFLMSKVKEISPVLPLPSIKETSPALAYT